MIKLTTRPTHFRWIIIFLLFSITVINYIDRASIAYAINSITPEFHLSTSEIGLILGAFGIGYAVNTFLGGIATDHYGARIVMFISVFFWSLSLILTGLSAGFISILIFRVLLGLSEGVNFPVMTRAVGDWLPREKRGAALSYGLMAVPLSLAISGPIVSHLIIMLSWRGMFIALGIISFLWLPLWWLFFRNHPEQSPYTNEQERALIHASNEEAPSDSTQQHTLSGKKVWRYLLSNKTLLANYWAFFVFGYFLFFFMTWLPRYLNISYHLDINKIGFMTILPWALATVFIWVMGNLSDSILKRSHSLRLARSYPIWLSQLLAALCLFPILFTHQLIIVAFFIALAVAFSMSANAAFYAINIDLAKERAATALGIMDTGFAISGFLAPTITGWVVSTTGSFHSAWLLMIGLALSSVIITILFHQPDRCQRLADYL